MERLTNLLRERYLARERVIAELNLALEGRNVRLSIEEASEYTQFKKILGEMLSGSSIRSDVISAILRSHRPAALASAVLSNQAGSIEAADESRTGKAERARKIVELLSASPRIFELQTLVPDDVVRLELSHAGVQKSSMKRSPGQRASAILPILFHRAEGPLSSTSPRTASTRSTSRTTSSRCCAV